MKKYIILLLFVTGICSCSPISKKEKVYYIYNSKLIFQKGEIDLDTIHYISYHSHRILPFTPIGLHEIDKIGVTYSLNYYLKWGKYKDTTFVKHKSYLDSIDFYGTEWLKNNDNVARFWRRSSGYPDSLKIYLFEPIPGSDSLIFRRVHRYFDHPED